MPFAVPFPKLLLRKRLWIGVCVLALVGGIYFYTRLDEVLMKVKGHIFLL